MAKDIENKNQSAKSNSAAMKNCIRLSVTLTKIEQSTQGILSSIPQYYTKMNKINENSARVDLKSFSARN